MQNVTEWAAAWDKYFPKKGPEIADLLAPFLSPALSFRPKPPHRILQDELGQIISWREVAGVKIIETENIKSNFSQALKKEFGRGLTVIKAEDLKEGQNIPDICEKRLWTTLTDSLEGGPKKELRETLGGPRWFMTLQTIFSFSSARYSDLYSKLRRDLGGDLEVIWNVWVEEIGNGLGYSIHRDLSNTLRIAIASALTEETIFNPRPLLGLWRSGNLPLGFNSVSELVILCDSRQNFLPPV